MATNIFDQFLYWRFPSTAEAGSPRAFLWLVDLHWLDPGHMPGTRAWIRMGHVKASETDPTCAILPFEVVEIENMPIRLEFTLKESSRTVASLLVIHSKI